MTFRMKPEYDRKGRVSASAGSGATIIRLVNDKELGFTCLKSRWVLQHTPLLFFTKGEPNRGGCRTPS